MSDEEPAKLSGFFGFILSPKSFLEAVDRESKASPSQAKEQGVVSTAFAANNGRRDSRDEASDDSGDAGSTIPKEIILIETLDQPLADVRNENFYEMLRLRSNTSDETIRSNFLRITKRVLRTRANGISEFSELQFEEKITQLALARQVLLDPATKKQYDYNLENGFESKRNKAETLVDASSIKLETVIRYSKAVSVAKLNEAIEATKDQPQYALPQYLAKNGDLDEYDLVSITQAYQLILKGKINLSQFELLFEEARESGTPLWVALVAKGWAKYSDF